MGISIEVYRARIGLHNIKAKYEVSCCLNGKFSNAMLILLYISILYLLIRFNFYLSEFYLPCLKQELLKQDKSGNNVVWFTQMLCYNVYMALLLRLSNDIEENPGPTNISLNEIIDPSQTVYADFSQGDESRFGHNAGKQCVAMSLTSIVYNEINSVNIWETCYMNTVLVNGNSLYNCISKSINKDLLLLTDVPEMVSIDNKIYQIHYSASFSGDVFARVNNGPFVSLLKFLLF